MVLVHAKLFKFGFFFALRVESAEVALKFHDEEVEVHKPCGGMEVQESGFETIQYGSLQIQKSIVYLGFSILKEVLLIPKIQFALKDEGSEFLGVGTIKWIRLLEFWLG